MKRLSKDSFEKAKKWIGDNARPLEKSLFEFHFSDGSAEHVIDALKSFQNLDGGFGNALEPDLRTPRSSVLGTSLAFQILRTLQVTSDNDLVKTAVTFLVSTYNKKVKSWRIIPREAENSPHAPWWNQKDREDSFDGFHLNPTAEILGVFYDYKDLVPESLIFSLASKVLDELSKRKEIEMHDFLCCKRLSESSNVEISIKNNLISELKRLLDTCVVKDSSKWNGYGLRPIQAADSPNSPFIHSLKKLVEENLDFEIDQQKFVTKLGIWSPTWSWSDNFPHEWVKAKKEWTGIITLEKLVVMDRFGRVDTQRSLGIPVITLT